MAFFVVAVLFLLYNFWNYQSMSSVQSDSFRKVLYKDGTISLFETFGFGVGVGQSSLINNFPMHSYFLEMLVENGFIFGFLGIFISFLAYLPNFKKMKFFSYEQKKIGIFCFAFSVSWFVVGFSSSLALSKTKIVWILYGILLEIKRNNFSMFEDMI